MAVKEVINVEGMSCEHCVTAVTKAAKSVRGVISVEVDLDGGTATVLFDGDVLEQVRAAIEEQGYDVN